MKNLLMSAVVGAVVVAVAIPASAALAPTEVKVASFEQVGTVPTVDKAVFKTGPNYAATNFTLTTAVPVPAALPLLASALVGLGIVRRRAKKSA
ncbi:MAG: VPLPA-CTERM sorting domain-containing protein [Geminicoccaceae bacterium]